MTEQDAIFVLGSLFGMYIVGWCAGYLIHFIKAISEKI